ncbi:GntR family transcriptional regulator [Ensifer sp. NM-2]|uniref:FadR/GntR family transcriptional regulator n=1 Tax=Ensifer sp. NM-2 TaxID=2109730 RepID=UPI000D135884|nr:FadR/GntR family transcriptional regulator [Ensifer sp. NM-2]PSS60239.1 GntR family transcriptional regulator [Ensifer sp. NM-2]
MQPATRTNLTDSAAESLRYAIADGRWTIGERIPNESDLCGLLCVSRGTVREAVKALVSQGLLETRQGSGTYVRSTFTSAQALVRIKSSGLRDLWEARTALDVEAARLAALRHTQCDLDHMAELLAARGTVADGGAEAFVRRDVAFHKSVVEASGNRALIELYDFFSSAILETIQSTLVGWVPEPDQKAHAAIIRAIQTGDAELAGAVARALSAPALQKLERLTATPTP